LVGPIIVVHGGAWSIPDDMVQAHVRGVRSAVAAGWEVLMRGGTAVAACEAAVVVMEDDDTFDAGYGSFLTRDGRVQLDAMIMEGHTLRAGGVGCVEHIRNPIRAARKIMEESPHVYLVGSDAERFAQAHGITLCRNSDLIVSRESERLRQVQAQERAQEHWKPPAEFSETRSHDTVGAVAIDSFGNLAAATSTGGTLNKLPGRVGDSSLIGCGCYADNESAAASLTGWGEPIMKLVLGKHACDAVRAGASPQQTANEALAYLSRRLDGHGGIILLDAAGRLGLAHNTPRMAWGFRTPSEEASGIEKR